MGSPSAWVYAAVWEIVRLWNWSIKQLWLPFFF
jgi:hypothetical protein